MATCIGILAWSGRAVGAGAMLISAALLLLVLPPWHDGRPAGLDGLRLGMRWRVYVFTAVGAVFIVVGLFR